MRFIHTENRTGQRVALDAARIVAIRDEDSGQGQSVVYMDDGRSFTVQGTAQAVTRQTEEARIAGVVAARFLDPIYSDDLTHRRSNDALTAITAAFRNVDAARVQAGLLWAEHARHSKHHSEEDERHYISGCMAMFAYVKNLAGALVETAEATD